MSENEHVKAIKEQTAWMRAGRRGFDLPLRLSANHVDRNADALAAQLRAAEARCERLLAVIEADTEILKRARVDIAPVELWEASGLAMSDCVRAGDLDVDDTAPVSST